MPADDTNRLAVIIEANTKSYERAIKRLEKTTGKALDVVDKRSKRTQRRFRELDNAMNGMGRTARRLAGLLAGAFTVRELARFADQATRIENSLKVAGLAGEELDKVYESLFDSAQRNAAPLEALAELYGKVALVQKELGVTSGELSAFTDNVALALRVSGKSAQESSGALLQLSQALGAGTVRAEEFNSILEGAPTIAQAVAAGLKEANGSVAELRTLVIDGKVSSEAFFRAFEAGAVILEDKAASATFTLGQQMTRLQNAIADAAGKMDEATGFSDILGASLEKLAGIAETVGNAFERISANVGAIDGRPLDTLQQRASTLRKELEGLQDDSVLRFNLSGRTIPELIEEKTAELEQVNNAIRRAVAELGGTTPDTPFNISDRLGKNTKAVSLSDFKSPVSKATSKGQSEAEKRVRDIQREQEAIQKLIETKQFEISLIGASEIEYEKANATRNLGLSLTDEQRAKIEELTETIYRETEAWNSAQEAQAFFADTTFDALAGLVDGTKNAEDAVKDLTRAIARASLEAFLLGDGPLAGLFGTNNGSGGILGSLFSGLLGRAGGGTVSTNRPYIVGERGPELFVPRTAGSVVANQNIPGDARNGRNGTVVNIINNSGESVTQRQSNRGGTNIVDVMIGEMNDSISKGRMDGSMGQRYNLKPQTRRAG